MPWESILRFAWLQGSCCPLPPLRMCFCSIQWAACTFLRMRTGILSKSNRISYLLAEECCANFQTFMYMNTCGTCVFFIALADLTNMPINKKHEGKWKMWPNILFPCWCIMIPLKCLVLFFREPLSHLHMVFTKGLLEDPSPVCTHEAPALQVSFQDKCFFQRSCKIQI